MEGCSSQLCNACNQATNNPRVLECSHAFCLKCLESSNISKDSLKCPICQVEYEKTREGSKKPKLKGQLDELTLTLSQSNFNCDSCKTNQANKFCVECSFNYCSTCLEHHNRFPATSKHQLLPSILSQETAVSSNSICIKHSELITLFCENCKSVLCGQCLTLNHNNHKTRHLSQYIENKLKIKEGLVNHITSNFNDARDTIYDIELKASNLKKEIQKRGANVKKVVDSIVAKLIATVDEELMEHKNGADVVMKELKNMEAILNEQIESLKQQINNSDLKNMVETSRILDRCGDIPKYAADFDVSFSYHANKSRINLETIFGTLRKGWFCKISNSLVSLTARSVIVNFFKVDFNLNIST